MFGFGKKRKYSRSTRYPYNRQGGSKGLLSMLLTGGMWAWQNRDRIRMWLDQNPQVRDQLQRQARNLGGRLQNRGYGNNTYTSPQQGYTPPQQGYTPPQQGFGSSQSSGGDWGTPGTPGNPATGATRRISPEEAERAMKKNNNGGNF